MDSLKPLEKWTVVELRAALKARGLSEKGNKPDLIERLQEALNKAAVTEAPTAAEENAQGDQPLAGSEPALAEEQAPAGEPMESEQQVVPGPDAEKSAEGEQPAEQVALTDANGTDAATENAKSEGAANALAEEAAAPTEAAAAMAESTAAADNASSETIAPAEETANPLEQATSKDAQEDRVKGTPMAKTDYGPEEWEKMDIPDEFRPLPVLRVRNIKQEASPDDVKKVFEDAGIAVHSVVFDNVERNRNVALLRLAPPPLPWKLTAQELAVNPLDEALKKYSAQKEQEAKEAKAAADAQKAAEAAAAAAAEESVGAAEGGKDAAMSEGDKPVSVEGGAAPEAADEPNKEAAAEAAAEPAEGVTAPSAKDADNLPSTEAVKESAEVAKEPAEGAEPTGHEETKPAAADAGGDQKTAAAQPSRPVTTSHPPVILHVDDGRSEGDVLKVARYAAMRLNALQHPLSLLGDRLMIDAPTLQCTLYLGNVSFDSDEQLRGALEPLGRISRCFIMRGASGTSKGYAFVEFATPAEALKAKESLEAQSRKAFQDMMATKNDLQRQRGRSAAAKAGAAAAKDDGKDAQGEKLEGEKADGEQGGTVDAEVLKDTAGDRAEDKEMDAKEEADAVKPEPDTEMKDEDGVQAAEGSEPAVKDELAGGSKEEADGAAKSEDAEVAVKSEDAQPKSEEGDEGPGDGKDAQHQPQHSSKIMRAEFTHTKRVQDLFSRNLYLASLPMSFSDEAHLRKVFGEFGPVTSASITRGPQGYSKGFGFVEFQRSDHADAALKALDGNEVPLLGKLAISFVNPSKHTDRGRSSTPGRSPSGPGPRYSSPGSSGRGGMMTPGFRGGRGGNAPYFAGPGRGGYMPPPPPPPYGMSPMMARGGHSPYGGHGRGMMGRGYGGGYGMGGMGGGMGGMGGMGMAGMGMGMGGMGMGGFGYGGASILTRGGQGGYGGGGGGYGAGGGYGGGYGSPAPGYGSRGGHQQISSPGHGQTPRGGVGYGSGSSGSGAGTGGAGASSGYQGSGYGSGAASQQQQQQASTGYGSGQSGATYGNQSGQSQYGSLGAGGYGGQSGYGAQNTVYSGQGVSSYGAQSGYGSTQTAGYGTQSSGYGAQQQQATAQPATGYGAQQQQQSQAAYGNPQAAAGTYPTSYSAPAQNYGASSGYSAAATQQATGGYGAAAASSTGYGAQQSAAGYGAQQQQAATTGYPTSYSAPSQAYGASTGLVQQQASGYGATPQAGTGYGQPAQQQQGGYGAGAGYAASVSTGYTGYGQTSGYGATAHQQAQAGYGAGATAYGQQQQGQTGYAAYGQQSGGYGYGQQQTQQVGQKREGDGYGAYGGYGADYNKRPRY